MVNTPSPKNQKNKKPLVKDSVPDIAQMSFPMQEEIDRLEEMILDNTRIPFLNRTLVDEDRLINQLDLIRMNIPDSLEQALDVLKQKHQIIADAQNYAQRIIENAQRQAEHILDESKIIQQAEKQASQLRLKVQQECDTMQRTVKQECDTRQRKTLHEVEQVRRKVQQEVMKMREEAIKEAEDIQNEADDYADAILLRLEKQLTEMLKVVNNGRQQLNPEEQPPQVVNRPSQPQQKAS
jgi:cell division septum initiation protein DivIVA